MVRALFSDKLLTYLILDGLSIVLFHTIRVKLVGANRFELLTHAL